jgi:glycosyltransferase involved in cell wall biosynthesis
MLVGADPHKTSSFSSMPSPPRRDRYAVVMAGGDRRLKPQWQAHLGGADAFSGFFPDDQLSLLYSGALALVYPSVYEGFGLPILEAMQSGCPVITCHNSSIFEVAGNAALYVDECDAADLAEALAVLDPAFAVTCWRAAARGPAVLLGKSARRLEPPIAPFIHSPQRTGASK